MGVQYCKLNGIFVFYSEENYQGQIKYGGPGQSEYISDLEPKDQTVTKVGSVRIIGDLDNAQADTLTLFGEENLGGYTDRMLDENDSAVDLTFSPRSAVVTGVYFWTIYAGNDCRNIDPKNDVGDPKFITNLPSEFQFYGNIDKAVKGCHCENDTSTECP